MLKKEFNINLKSTELSPLIRFIKTDSISFILKSLFFKIIKISDKIKNCSLTNFFFVNYSFDSSFAVKSISIGIIFNF